MTGPHDFDLLEFATAYALDAVSDAERDEIERRRSAAPAPVARAFDAEVRDPRGDGRVVGDDTERTTE